MLTVRRDGNTMTLPVWHDDAPCRDANPRLFNLTDPENPLARQVVEYYCDRCPVIDDCMEWANGSDFDGIAAGFVWIGKRHRRTRPGVFTEEEMLAEHHKYTHLGVRDGRARAGERAYQRMRKRTQRQAAALAESPEPPDVTHRRGEELLESVDGWTKRQNRETA